MGIILYDNMIGDIYPEMNSATIIVHGAGKKGIRISEDLHYAGIEVGYYYDCEKNLQGTQINGIDIIDESSLVRILDESLCDVWFVSAIANPKESLLFISKTIKKLKKETKINFTSYWAVNFSLFINRNSIYKKESFAWHRIDSENDSRYIFVAELELYCLEELINSYEKSFFIFQPGKVGSTSIRYLMDEFNIPYLYLHHLGVSDKNNLMTYKRMVEKAVTRLSNQKLRIITMVREPISRDYSAFWEPFSEKAHERMKLLPFVGGNLQEMYNHYTSLMLMGNREMIKKYGILTPLVWSDEFEWFDEELRDGLGIDIYQHPFDKERGYQIIRNDNLEVFVFKLEKLNNILPRIYEFIGVSGNVAEKKEYRSSDKWFSIAYDELKKNLIIPKEYFNHYYEGNKKLDHFYTDEEKREFIKKWESHVQ